MVEASEDFFENQAHVYSMTALTAIIETMKDDNNAYDSKNEDWALVPIVEVPYGFISVDIKPLNAKIAINGMANSDEELATRYLNACTTIANETEADSLECEVVKDYIDADTEVSYGGAEGVTYERNGVLFRTKNKPLSSLYELRMLMNDNEQFNTVKDYLTVYSPEKAININFVSALTLKAFVPEIEDYADEIVDYAKTQEYKDPSNIKEAVDIPQDIYLKILPFLTVKSTLFYVKTEVTLNDKPRYYHALIQKDGTTAEVVNFLAGLNGQYY
ncbi:MAG: hypothetical protein C0603_04955 [Denitrovibrio sp.]|nr:MAG: hypothetical protein C0603_04955 [Denitrovibrio sp.]